MINRVFCYSKEVAIKNGNKLPLLQLVLGTFIYIIVVIFLAIIAPVNSKFFDILPVLQMVLFLVLVIYWSAILGLRLKSRIVGYATSNDGRIYQVMTTNNGAGFTIGGYAAGSMIDNVLGGSSNNVGGNIGGAVGVLAQISALNKSAKIMSHPEIIAKMIEQIDTTKKVYVREILKVHSYSIRKHSIKIKCDFNILKKNKIKYNKTIIIEKSYICIDDLISIIINKK